MPADAIGGAPCTDADAVLTASEVSFGVAADGSARRKYEPEMR
jgi:hypothetical protein